MTFAPLIRTLAALAGCLLASAAPASALQVGVPAAPPPEPKLVVLFTVDQLRPDFLERFSGQMSGGLGRLMRGGAVFTNTFQDHAATETAPGHASILSGRFPRSTGIVVNSAGVEDPQAPLVDAQGPGASPYRFRGSVLMDWLRLKDPRSRALSISRKDRGAILPLGRTKQQVFWYAPANGRFTTSTFYADTLPHWVQRFNARRLPQSYAGRSWNLLLPESAYAEPDSVPGESPGRRSVFPHTLSADTAEAVRQITEFPWMDEITLRLALEGMRELKLGTGAQTDLLAVSLSTTDGVGHRWGPNSRESHDQILRLDRALGAFLDSLYAMHDSARVVIALTADHGVAPYPAVYRTQTGKQAYNVEIGNVVRRHREAATRRGVDPSAVRFSEGMLFVERPALRRAGIDPDSLIRTFAAEVRAIPGVMRADLVSALPADSARDAIARRWLHSIPPDLPVELVVTLQPYSVWGKGTNAQHGNPHDYDARVPLLFYGPQFKPGRYAEFTRVVDIAPTLAEVVGVTPTEPLDGRVLTQALRQQDAAGSD